MLLESFHVCLDLHLQLASEKLTGRKIKRDRSSSYTPKMIKNTVEFDFSGWARIMGSSTGLGEGRQDKIYHAKFL